MIDPIVRELALTDFKIVFEKEFIGKKYKNAGMYQSIRPYFAKETNAGRRRAYGNDVFTGFGV